jgi:hypothetical protein
MRACPACWGPHCSPPKRREEGVTGTLHAIRRSRSPRGPAGAYPVSGARSAVRRAGCQHMPASLDYRILPPETDPDAAAPGGGISLSSLPLNCDILVPADDEEIPAGRLTIRGWALAGDGRRIDRVDVSLDDGRSWRQADLEPVPSKWARPWSLTVDARPGPICVTARAWDETGVTQPESPAHLWNPRGYGNNAWAHVKAFAR